MPRFARLVTTLALSAALVGCGLLPGKVKLTDQTITRYVVAVNALRASAPATFEALREGKLDVEAAKAGATAIDQAAKQAGFTNGVEFMRVNAAVAWAFSQTKGGAFMKETDANVKRAKAEMDRQLANPQVPEATKAEIRKSRAQLEAQYQQGKGWADVALKVGGALTDEESMKVVQRHEAELMGAFMGR